MISAGVLILLFVAFQLWGTGLRTGASQSQALDDFKIKQAETARNASRATTKTVPTTVGTSAAPVASTAAPTTGVAQPATGEFPPPKPGDPIGVITIPKIGAEFATFEGVDLNYLTKGPGHFPGTPFPGQAGNAAIAGHRTTWAAPFNRIDELEPGDPIEIQTLQGTFHYEVMPAPGPAPGTTIGYKIVTPAQTEILAQTVGQNTLTLMACHPKYSAAQRIVVVARLVEAPAPTTEKSVESQAATQTPDQEALIGAVDAGELLANNPEDRRPALLWSGLAAAIWFGAWLVARRWPTWRNWRRWTVYAAALPLFIVPLFFAFEHINHMLPAGY